MSEQLIQTPGPFGENGNFLLERELGAGGMGGVYMGRDKMLDRPVAVKVMLKELGADAEFVEKFKKEAQSAARLIHPNIAQVYSYGICDGMPYIAMELASGGSLYTLMNANQGKTDIPRVIKICQQVAQALQCASDQGCVHGDVKPENILLDANGNAKLVDFGLAAMQKDTNEIWGTPYYISPEKVKKEPIDFRADMYSLGGTLYHALTGVAPFEGEDSIAVVKKRFDGAPKKPSEIRADISSAIDDLVMRMLAFNKEDRFPSFESLLEAFKNVLTTGLTTQKLTPPPATAASGASSGGGTRRMTTMRSRRTMMMKRPTGTTTIKKKLDGEAGDEGAVDDSAVSASTDDDEEENGGNLALKVVGVVVGVVLLIVLTAGGLIWYQIADKRAREADELSQISSGYNKAVQAINESIVSAGKFADEIDVLADRAVAECQKSTDELKKILPEEQSALLKPALSKELLDAIASTNEVQAAAAPAAEAPAATNTTNTVAAATNAVAAAATPAAAPAPAPAAAAASAAPAAEKAVPPPPVVITMNELWERAYSCQASAIKVRHAIRKIEKRGREADEVKTKTRDSINQLAELSRDVVDLLDQVKASKDVENVRKGAPFIRSKGSKTVEQTIKRLRIEKLEADRKAKAEAAAAAEKARLEKIEAERKAKVDEERAAIKGVFDGITAQGCFRQLDWRSAIRQLETAKSEFKTAEGEIAADIEIRKVNAMKKVQDVLIKGLNGHVFRGKLKGAKVVKVDEKGINLVRSDNKKQSITWQKFYKDYPGNLNEVINAYIVNARQINAKNKLSLNDWAEAMSGAALTMQLVCSDVNGAVERAMTLAKEAVKQHPEFLPTAKEIFPDITFDAAEEE